MYRDLPLQYVTTSNLRIGQGSTTDTILANNWLGFIYNFWSLDARGNLNPVQMDSVTITDSCYKTDLGSVCERSQRNNLRLPRSPGSFYC
jgi:hypothetical protein